MKRNLFISGLSLLMLTSCGCNMSGSVEESLNTSSNPTSLVAPGSTGTTDTNTTNTSTNTTTTNTPTSTPTTSNSETLSVSETTSTVVPPSSTSTQTSELPEVAAKAIRLTAESLKEDLPSTSSSEETLVSADDLELGFVSANYGTYSGNGYIMMRKTSDTNGAGHIYNKTSLGNVTSIVVKFSSSTSTNAILGVTFGNSVMTNALTTFDKSSQASVNGIVTITNDSGVGDYFNLSVTNNYNLQISELVINLNGATETIEA